MTSESLILVVDLPWKIHAAARSAAGLSEYYPGNEGEFATSFSTGPVFSRFNVPDAMDLIKGKERFAGVLVGTCALAPNEPPSSLLEFLKWLKQRGQHEVLAFADDREDAAKMKNFCASVFSTEATAVASQVRRILRLSEDPVGNTRILRSGAVRSGGRAPVSTRARKRWS